MQSTSKDICKDNDLLKSINDILFMELKQQIEKVPNLIIDVPPLGRFYYRRRKTLVFKNGTTPKEEKDQIFLNRISDLYEEFMKDKQQIRYERYGEENYKAYILAKKEERLQQAKEDKSK